MHATNAHPAPLVHLIPYRKYLRLKRNCSTTEAFEIEAGLLRDRLRMRGYSKKCLAKAYNQARGKTRDSLLFHKKVAKKNGNVRFVTRYSSQHEDFKAILQKHWYLLMSDLVISGFVPPQSFVVYRRASSLKDKLVHSHLTGPSPKTHSLKGIFQCGGCPYCKYINTAKT